MASPVVMAATTVVAALLLLAGFRGLVLSGGGACLWDSYANCYKRAHGVVSDGRRAAGREGDITPEAFAEARSSPGYSEGSPPAPSTGRERIRAAVGSGNIYPVGGTSLRTFSADHYPSAPGKTVVTGPTGGTPGFDAGSRRRSLGSRRPLQPPSPKVNTGVHYWMEGPPPPPPSL
ncbi:hypothetical protein Taro_055865 [Colocasia esculenta]|uniref:Uncharacterized protein n=1 Tax=Colocasia esculenta TaxID=4460 RepID=A0A843XS20_COLES|nr:hypothetical protein [Colocasia esculenta]